jgi:hypothetical protein
MISGYHIGAFRGDRMVKKIRNIKTPVGLKIYRRSHNSQQQKLIEPALPDGVSAAHS